MIVPMFILNIDNNNKLNCGGKLKNNYYPRTNQANYKLVLLSYYEKATITNPHRIYLPHTHTHTYKDPNIGAFVQSLP